MRALIAGTFDPITVGHSDIIRRASLMFDEIVVVIFNNSEKQNFFTDKQRIEMAEIACADISNVKIDSYDGMLAEYMKTNGINIIIKGVRNVSDFTYEYMLAEINRSVYNDIETLFMSSKPEFQHVSSSVVREFLKHGADISKLVPPAVLEYIKGVKK